jgi:hypothetical protein
MLMALTFVDARLASPVICGILFSTSRRRLVPSPTCQTRQGGIHESGMWPEEPANVAEAPAFAEFVEEAQ